MDLDQKKLNILVKSACKYTKNRENAEDVVFSIIELLITTNTPVSYGAVKSRLKNTFFSLYIQPLRYEHNKEVKYFNFIGIGRHSGLDHFESLFMDLTSSIDERALDLRAVFTDMDKNLSKIKKKSLHKLINGDTLNLADRQNVFTIRKLYKGTYETKQ